MTLPELLIAETTRGIAKFIRGSTIVPERTPINEWLPANRILRHGAATGHYSTEFFPPINQILEDASSYKYPRIVLKAGVQSGKTEAMMSLLLWSMAEAPADVIFLVPRDTDKRAILIERIKPAIAATRASADTVDDDANTTTKGGRDLSIRHNGGFRVRMRAAGSTMELASVGAKVLIADEVDKYGSTVRDGGDPISLLQGRGKNYYDSVLVMACSPTTDYDPETGRGSIIEHAYQNSNRMVWQCLCPHCGAYEHWKFDRHVKWDTAEPTEAYPLGEELAETAHLQCSKCKGIITEQERMTAVRAGRWFVKNPNYKLARGYTWSRLIFPLSDLASVVTDYLHAKGNMHRMQAFTNDVLAEVFRPGKSTLRPPKKSTDTSFELLRLKPSLVYTTMGVDVQGDRLVCVTLGYDSNNTIHVLSHRVLSGNPALGYDFKDPSNIWQKLHDYMNTPLARPNQVDLCCQAAAIDAGHLGSRVMEFVATERFNGTPIDIYPVKGGGTKTAWSRPFIPQKEPGKTARSKFYRYTERSTTIKKQAQVPLWILGGNQGKNEWAGLTEAGKIVFCQMLTAEYFNELDSESLVPHSTGSLELVWKHTHGKNDALDATLYGYAAHRILRLRNKLYSERDLTKLRAHIGHKGTNSS